MADGFRAFAVGERAVQSNALLACELGLLTDQFVRQVEQAHRLALRRHHVVEKRQVVLKEVDRRRVVDRLIADQLLVKDGRHRRDVLVAEAYVRTHEAGVARLDRFDAAGVF